MARTVRGRKSAGKKAASRKAAPKAKAKSAPVRKVAAKSRAKTAVKKAAPKKTAARTPAKKAVARVPAARRTAPRRARVAAPPRRKVAAPKVTAPRVPAPQLKAAAPAQRFAVSHLNEADFVKDGLRSYALYRDLGIAAASGGLCQAHVIRLLSPCTDEVRQRHLHEPELQLIYVLQGWVKNEFEGEGVQMMSAGSCWLQPPGIKHTVLDYSADVELLEIIVPADFKTMDAD